MTMSVLTAVGGMSLAPGEASMTAWACLIIGTTLLVGAANTFNMYVERDIDGLMPRTKTRPLPAGRLDPTVALVFGIVQALIAVPLLTIGLNPLTGMLGLAALFVYVLCYTPLKQKTALAVLFGAIPGAMPPLLGWTAMTGSIQAPALAIFGILFLWQIPHTHAIMLFRFKEYERAGFVTLPSVRGERGTRITMVPYVIGHIVASLLLLPLGVGRVTNNKVALTIGIAYLAFALVGLRKKLSHRWARQFFIASLAYLTVLFAALLINGQY